MDLIRDILKTVVDSDIQGMPVLSNDVHPFHAVVYHAGLL